MNNITIEVWDADSGGPALAARSGPTLRSDELASVPHGSQTETHLVQRHRQMLGIACGVLVLSLVLQMRSDDHAALAIFPDWPIPSSCPSQTIFGVDCPGCGLTRSFIHLAHGDWHRAFSKHRVGWLLALAVVLQIPYRLTGLLSRNRQPLGQRFPKLFGMALIVALVGNWVLLMFHV